MPELPADQLDRHAGAEVLHRPMVPGVVEAEQGKPERALALAVMLPHLPPVEASENPLAREQLLEPLRDMRPGPLRDIGHAIARVGLSASRPHCLSAYIEVALYQLEECALLDPRPVGESVERAVGLRAPLHQPDHIGQAVELAPRRSCLRSRQAEGRVSLEEREVQQVTDEAPHGGQVLQLRGSGDGAGSRIRLALPLAHLRGPALLNQCRPVRESGGDR